MDRIRLTLLLLLFIWLIPQPATSNPASSGLDAPPIREEARVPGTNRTLSPEPSPHAAQRRGGENEEVLQEGAVGQEGSAGEAEDEEAMKMPDPLRPFNKAVFVFNDKLYFWLLKPVTQGYIYVTPEPFRIIVDRFADNLKAPTRVVNHLLQFRMKEAGNEFIRFAFNSTGGLGGIADAAKELLHIEKTDADFGQTLAFYGIGHGFYLVLPVFGASSFRDGIGLGVDRAMYPVTYLSFTDLSLEAAFGIAAFEIVNTTSFHIGDYEALKQAAIDPYVSMRDAYYQNRKKTIQEIRKESR